MININKFIVLAIAFCLCTAAFTSKTMAQPTSGQCGNNLFWDLNTATMTLTISGTGDMYNYEMCSAPWDEWRTNMQTLVLPEGITSIGNHAFEHCEGFTGTLTLPNSLQYIGSSAFGFCTGFTGSLTLPNSLLYIGHSAFFNCSGLMGGLTIPNSVEIIENYAFKECRGFTGLTIGNQVRTIGDFAFDYCTGFTGSLNHSKFGTDYRRQCF
jgi:hypothetical protein